MPRTSESAQLYLTILTQFSTGSVGKLLPNMECKLLDDDGKEVGVGEPGEIFIRGPNVCLGYWKNQEASDECLSADGWLKTGDVAVIDNERRFWIVDRKKVGSFSCFVAKTDIGKGINQSQRSPSCTSRAGSSTVRARRRSGCCCSRNYIVGCLSKLCDKHLLTKIDTEKNGHEHMSP